MNIKINPLIIETINSKGLNYKRSLLTLLCLYHGLDDPGAEEELYSSGIFEINSYGLFPQITFLYPLYIVESQKSNRKEFDEFMVKWLDKWPTQSKTGLNRSISGNTAACNKRMLQFINEFTIILKDVLKGGKPSFGVICETINKATDTYLSELEHTGYFYAKKNSKFINDREGSFLENYCRKVIKGEVESFSGNIMDRQA